MVFQIFEIRIGIKISFDIRVDASSFLYSVTYRQSLQSTVYLSNRKYSVPALHSDTLSSFQILISLRPIGPVVLDKEITYFFLFANQQSRLDFSFENCPPLRHNLLLLSNFCSLYHHIHPHTILLLFVIQAHYRICYQLRDKLSSHSTQSGL